MNISEEYHGLMQWTVENKAEFDNRQKYIIRLIDEKTVKIKEIQFEINALFYLHTTLRNIGWDK